MASSGTTPSSSILSPELLIVIVVTLLTRTLCRTPPVCERILVGTRMLETPHASTLLTYLSTLFKPSPSAAAWSPNALSSASVGVLSHLRPVAYSRFTAATHADVWSDEASLASLQTACLAAIVSATTTLIYTAYEAWAGGLNFNPMHLHVCLAACVLVSLMSNAPHMIDALTRTSTARATEVYLSLGVGLLTALLSLLLTLNLDSPLHALLTGSASPSALASLPYALPLAGMTSTVATAHCLAWLRMARCHYDTTRMAPTFLPQHAQPTIVEYGSSSLAFAAPFLSLAVITSTHIPAPLLITSLLALAQLAAVRVHVQAFQLSAVRRVLEHFITAAAAAAPRCLTMDSNPLSPAAMQLVLESCSMEVLRVKLGVLTASLQVVTPPISVLALSVLAAHASVTADAAQHTVDSNVELWETLDAAAGPGPCAVLRLLLNGHVLHAACVHILTVVFTSACLVQAAGLVYWEYIANRAALPKVAPASVTTAAAAPVSATAAAADTIASDADAAVRRRR